MSTTFVACEAVSGAEIGRLRATETAEMPGKMAFSASAGEKWRRTEPTERIEIVRAFGDYLGDHREEITDLISREVGKLSWDAAGEVAAAIAKVSLSIEAFNQRRSTQTLSPMATGSARVVRYQPLGVTLVLGPFNFPLHLPGGQIIPALLSGNSVVFKPSERATAVGMWMQSAWRHAGLPDDVLQVIVGGPDVAIAAIDSPHIQGVFLTGSRAAGRAIHRQLAGRPGVLLALELGGHNSVVTVEPVDPVAVADVVSFSAFVSAGQRCTCARRAIFVDADEAIKRLIDRTKSLTVGLPGDGDAQVGPVISAAAADSLHQTYKLLIDLGCNDLLPWQTDSRHAALLRPMIVDATDISDDAKTKLGELEWFGPLLVIERARDFDAAVESAARTPYGLAAALLGGDERMFESFVDRVGAGVVNWNGPTTGAAGVMPFGGRGDSGNHRPAGYHAIDFCSDPVSSLQLSTIADANPWDVAVVKKQDVAVVKKQ